MRGDIAATADRFTDVRAEAPAETARRIANDAVDILVDLGGHTTEHRLAVLAHRPGRVFRGAPGAAARASEVLCAFHQSAKITEQVFDAWREILRAAPDSVLWLRKDSAEAMRNLAGAARSRQIEPSRPVR